MSVPPPGEAQSAKRVESRDSVVIRFAGDSGDGMQLTGTEFAKAAAEAGNDISTFPDFPAEIRAPAGSLFGVSGFQLHFSSSEIHTPGDAPDVLVAMNPAALKTNLRDLKKGGLLILNSGTFNATNLKKAGYDVSPLENNSLDGWTVLSIDITKHTVTSVKDTGLSNKEAHRCAAFNRTWSAGRIHGQADIYCDARAGPRLVRARGRSAHVRRSAAFGEPDALRLPARVRRRAEVVGRPERSFSRSCRKAPRRVDRRPSVRVRVLRGRHTARAVRRGRGDRLGLRRLFSG